METGLVSSRDLARAVAQARRRQEQVDRYREFCRKTGKDFEETVARQYEIQDQDPDNDDEEEP